MATRIVTRHMTRRTAQRKLARFQAAQLRAKAGESGALDALAKEGLTANESLDVRKENHRFFKWAVISK